jgi:putative component of toxin-antitoxin plasmid stabilization module
VRRQVIPRLVRSAFAIYAPDGRKPFEEWVESLKDHGAKARVLRLERVRSGNLGECKPVGEVFPNCA